MERRADRAHILLPIVAFAALAALVPFAFWLGGIAVGLIIIVAESHCWPSSRRAGSVAAMSRSGPAPILFIGSWSSPTATPTPAGWWIRWRRTNAATDDEVRIVVPALTMPLKRLGGDVDDEIRDAEASAERLADEARASGRNVSGGVGDTDPRLAVEDALRVFAADEVLVFPPSEDELWAHRVPVPEETFGRVRLPVTVVERDAP